MKLLKLVALSFVTSMSALGCSAGSEGDPADTDEAEGELAVGNQNLVGAFVFPGGGAFQALVLRSDGTFMADVDSGVRCASAPCTSTQRLTGNARVTKKTITLKAAEEVTPINAAYLGRFSYTFMGSTLTLKRGLTTYDFETRDSYCSQPSDCPGQSSVAPMCFPLNYACVNSACSAQCGLSPEDLCSELDQAECQQRSTQCRAKFGPSSCTPGPNPRCTRDMVWKSCEKK